MNNTGVTMSDQPPPPRERDVQDIALNVFMAWKAMLPTDRPFGHDDGARFIQEMRNALGPVQDALTAQQQHRALLSPEPAAGQAQEPSEPTCATCGGTGTYFEPHDEASVDEELSCQDCRGTGRAQPTPAPQPVPAQDGQKEPR